MPAPTPAQIRAGRAMVDWSKIGLAKAARLSVSVVHRYESGDLVSGSGEDIALMQDALETEGVRFLADDGNGPGVRFKRR